MCLLHLQNAQKNKKIKHNFDFDFGFAFSRAQRCLEKQLEQCGPQVAGGRGAAKEGKANKLTLDNSMETKSL